jgi:serine/threonine-protein kinase RsbW
VCSLQPRTTCRTAADCEAVNRCHERLDRLWESHPGVPLRERARFETALVEIVGNVVRHARPRPGQRLEVAVELSVDASFLEARVHEFGAVHADIPHLRAPGPARLTAEAESGRGLAMVRSLVETLAYSRTDGGNVWTLRRRHA